MTPDDDRAAPPRRLPVAPGAGEPRDPGPPSADGAALMPRRTALKAMAAAAAALPTVAGAACEGSVPDAGDAPPRWNPKARGTPADPDLVAPRVAWESVLSADELRTVRALCDVILPADDRSPSASAVGVPAFIDEWVSAPYPSHLEDRVRIRGGLVWLNGQAHARFGAAFAELTPERQRAICDDISHVDGAAPEFRPAARFFDRFRDLTASGFWTTPEGMADLGYLGNVPLPTWDGPPPEILERLGLG